MNTGSTQPIGREFLDKITRFETKVKESGKGPKLTKEEVHDFFKTITSSTQLPTDPALRKQIAAKLHSLRTTLGTNKSVVEAAAAAVPFTQLHEALGKSIAQFSEDYEKSSQKVGRKDTGGMAGH